MALAVTLPSAPLLRVRPRPKGGGERAIFKGNRRWRGRERFELGPDKGGEVAVAWHGMAWHGAEGLHKRATRRVQRELCYGRFD